MKTITGEKTGLMMPMIHLINIGFNRSTILNGKSQIQELTMNKLKAGFSKIDITPPVGTPIGGNFRDDYSSKGVFHPLYAKAVYVDDGSASWVIAIADLVGVTVEMTSEIRSAVSERTGLAADQIMVAAIHTHSGPDTFAMVEESTVAPEVLAEINRKIADCIVQAVESAEEVKVYYGRGENDKIGNNRRLRTKDGATHMSWEFVDPDFIDKVLGPTDPEISVLKFEDAAGKIKSIFVNYTCHPAILAGDNCLMCADYVGFLYKRLESEYSEDVTVVFSNGAAGQITHIDSFDPTQGRGFEEAERLGVMLAEDVIKIVPVMTGAGEIKIGYSREILDIPRRKIDDERLAWAKKVVAAWDGSRLGLIDGFPDEYYAQETLYLKEDEDKPFSTELQVFSLSDEVAFVSVPGELFVEFGLEIKQKSPFAHTPVIELANESVGYIPTPIAFEEGGYEPTPMRHSHLDPCAGEMLVESALRQLNKLK